MPLRSDDEVRSREELVVFLSELHQEVRRHGDRWEKHTLDQFLEVLAAWAHDIRARIEPSARSSPRKVIATSSHAPSEQPRATSDRYCSLRSNRLGHGRGRR
ncbi:DUF7660 family protein [Streptomyces shenzhenensis]|uniref:DUF7660 family protein n=1 Tax=Streptomyces shenzhenensis TaxID=943815 RepID=UPI003F541086